MKFNIIAENINLIKSRFKTEKGIILLYHRITLDNEQPDPFNINVSLTNFEEHLKIIKDVAEPVNLYQIPGFLQNNYLPKRFIILTFDDGYSGFHKLVKPLLDKYELPATVFVITGYLGKIFWWDELVNIIFLPDKLPGILSIKFKGFRGLWKVSGSSEMERMELLRTLHKCIRDLSNEDQNIFISQLYKHVNINPDQLLMERSLNHSEIFELVGSNYITIGSHSITHPSLKLMSYEEQNQQITESKMELENMLGKNIDAFSYPFGLKLNFSSITMDILKQAGFKCACTNTPDIVGSSSNPYELPRLWIKDWNNVEFARRIKKWMV